MKKKNLGSSTSFVHGKEKEIICHDMRKYVWQKYDFLKIDLWKHVTRFHRSWGGLSGPELSLQLVIIIILQMWVTAVTSY